MEIKVKKKKKDEKRRKRKKANKVTPSTTCCCNGRPHRDNSNETNNDNHWSLEDAAYASP